MRMGTLLLNRREQVVATCRQVSDDPDLVSASTYNPPTAVSSDHRGELR